MLSAWLGWPGSASSSPLLPSSVHQCWIQVQMTGAWGFTTVWQMVSLRGPGQPYPRPTGLKVLWDGVEGPQGVPRHWPHWQQASEREVGRAGTESRLHPGSSGGLAPRVSSQRCSPAGGCSVSPAGQAWGAGATPCCWWSRGCSGCSRCCGWCCCSLRRPGQPLPPRAPACRGNACASRCTRVRR